MIIGNSGARVGGNGYMTPTDCKNMAVPESAATCALSRLRVAISDCTAAAEVMTQRLDLVLLPCPPTTAGCGPANPAVVSLLVQELNANTDAICAIIQMLRSTSERLEI